MNMHFNMVLCVVILFGFFIFSSLTVLEKKRKAPESSSKIVVRPPQMTDEEIKGMFTLLDTDKDGWLTLKQFEELMQFSDDELDKELKKYFTEMGTNNRLAYDEFYLLMTKPIEKIYRTQENSKKMLEFMGLFRTNNTEPSKIDS